MLNGGGDEPPGGCCYEGWKEKRKKKAQLCSIRIYFFNIFIEYKPILMFPWGIQIEHRESVERSEPRKKKPIWQPNRMINNADENW